jgi:cytochrome c
MHTNFVARLHLCLALASLMAVTGCNRNDAEDKTVDQKRFVKVPLTTDLDEPTEMAILPNNDVLVIERKGAVKLYSAKSKSTKQIASISVYTGEEDGLLGVALDPQYTVNNFVYFYYSPTGATPVQHVSRFGLKGDQLQLASEKVLLKIPTQRKECCHSAGSIAFGPDGNLFIAVGDNTNPHNPGYYNSIDERKGRDAWDAQRTAGNTNDLRGKILRIHPEPDGTYTIPNGNLFPPGTDSTRPEIYAMGCRNPYRISVDPKRGWLFWGDVGQNTIDDPKRGPISYDEWNLAKEAGFFGWPYFAGPNAPYADFDFETGKIGAFFDAASPINESPNNTGLKKLPPAKEALIWYSYTESKQFKYLGTGGKSPIGGPVYHADLFKEKINDTTEHLPDYYSGKFFIAEWMRDWINVVTLKQDGKIDSIERFMPSVEFNHPIDLEIGGDGVLYVLEYGTYWFAKNKDAGLYRIEYIRGNRSPVAEMKADKMTGSVPLTVQFSSDGSFDSDSSALTYKWYFDRNEVQSRDKNPAYTFKQPGVYKVRLEVSDEQGKSGEKIIEVRVGNAAPEIDLITKLNKSFYWDDTPIDYQIRVTDLEDGSVGDPHFAKDAVNVSIHYTTMGPDITMAAQANAAVTRNQKGAALIEKSDCNSCHGVKDTSVGPSFFAIATRYKQDDPTVHKLVRKIIDGGSGAWGERVMSAHPQLSEQEAADMVSYIFSVDDKKQLNQAASLTGTIKPKKKDRGEYIVSVSYQDSSRFGVGSNLARKDFYFRHAEVMAPACNEEKDVKIDESFIQFTGNGAWIMYRDLDLRNISSLAFKIDPSLIGGRLSIHLDKPDGKEIGSVSFDKSSAAGTSEANSENRWVTVTAKVFPPTTTHDVYIVYHNPADAQANMWVTLSLESILFKK